LTPHEVMTGEMKGKEAIVVGGEGVGMALALFLVRQGVEVTLLERGKRLGRDVNPFYLWRYLQLLKGRTRTLTSATPLRFEGGRLVVATPDGEEALEADLLITALRGDRGEELSKWQERFKEVLIIGDARRPRRLHNAIHEAYRKAREI
ncbi:MAG: hypothetical protein DRG36_05695, partial [Deltaproteobacteria bacterium]